jgi:hypothetical protein
MVACCRSSSNANEDEQAQAQAQAGAAWLDDNDDFVIEELFMLLSMRDVRRRRVTRPLGARLRTFAWNNIAVPLWQGFVVCLGTLTLKRLYLQSL